MAEHLTVDQAVVGSTPIAHPMDVGPAERLALIFGGRGLKFGGVEEFVCSCVQFRSILLRTIDFLDKIPLSYFMPGTGLHSIADHDKTLQLAVPVALACPGKDYITFGIPKA